MKTNRIAIVIAFSVSGLSGCISGLVEKDETATLSKSGGGLLSTGGNDNGGTVVDVPAGAAVGNMMVPNFKTARDRFAEAMAVNPTQGETRAVMASGLAQNLPDNGVPQDVSGGSMFSYTKLITAVCMDRITADYNGTTNAGRIVGALRLNQNHLVTPNTQANWEAYYRNLAERLWGRMTITAEEISAFNRLKSSVAASVPNANTNAYPVALALCVAAGTSLDAIAF